MKKAFTLIELLVVIAIIAILAAILFPVLAQARTAAKKTVAISNQKQIALGFVMYATDNDDMYPRRSGCELNSSLNQKFRDPSFNATATAGCTGPFYNSMTWQSWQKYVMTYVKNTDLFTHPLRQKNANDWNNNGQILNSFVINLGVMGASVSGFNSIPINGGSQGGVARPSETMMLAEMPNTYGIGFATPGGNPPGEETVYPLAIRELWERVFFRVSGANNCTVVTPVKKDIVGAGPHGGMVVGMADGSAKFVSVDQFLARTPRNAEYLPGRAFPGTSHAANCRRATSAYLYGGNAAPALDINYPFWGLGE